MFSSHLFIVYTPFMMNSQAERLSKLYEDGSNIKRERSCDKKVLIMIIIFACTFFNYILLVFNLYFNTDFEIF